MSNAHPTGTEVTQLLMEAEQGSARAAGRLMDLVYGELRSLAGALMRSSPPGTLLQPTALVHEAWMKLVGNMGGVESRRHFLAIAARAMRQVLADHARAAKAAKRGSGAQRLTLADSDGARPGDLVDIVAFQESLARLEKLSERQAKVVELRVLGSLTIEETAVTLGVSTGTVKTDWAMARAWLMHELAGDK
ncbi:MAG: sigma-70 family RNA polymerase sigma factor [Phycisphaerales bacterium]|nr:sigma-70 family RNA polymerase sigma factor [Phycisphaerales bacterium]